MRPNHQITVKPGQWVQVCFNAKLSDTVGAAPLVRARLSKPLRVFAVNSRYVRIGGDCMAQGSWHASWVRCAKPEIVP